MPRPPMHKSQAWWYLSRRQKEILQREREAGDYGGERAAAAGRAPYFWAQEHGEPRAAIRGKHITEGAYRVFINRTAPNVVSGYFDRLEKQVM